MDVQRPFALVDAVHRALLDAGLVLEVNTRLGDHVRHGDRVCRPRGSGRHGVVSSRPRGGCTRPRRPGGRSW
ncbi:hypothetical protein [Ornithinimicrobium kibberense]|uniref:hypothetical protein n=1 Tax=Ornithinimicrobium kibberense TaxID=282060 RepID=UPI00360DC439